MSEENVEVVRQLLEDFHAGVTRGDPGAGYDSAPLPDDFEYVMPEGIVNPGGKRVLHGRAEFVEFFRTWTEEFEDWSQQAERLIDADDRVVALTRQSAVGKASGARVELQLGQIYEFEEGRLIRVRFYIGYGDTLEAAGVSE